jgi:hypothetical protein
MKSSFKRFENLVTALFPEADQSEPQKLDYFCMDLLWHSNDDPKRKSKRTKTFRIIISQEQMEDFENLSPKEKEQFENRVKQFITNKKSQMVPNHNNPYGVAAPIEEWRVEA